MSRQGFIQNNLTGILMYQSFNPSPLPPVPALEINMSLQTTIINAHKNLSFLESLSDFIPNKDLFISLYVRKEALMSSQIEGTQATLEDILDPLIEENANQNVDEVMNYIKATHFAINRLETLPLCNRLIREIHAVLMDQARGQEKTPGAFRTSQNWIGGIGSTLKNARYIPPAPDVMVDAMSQLELYMHEAMSKEDPLIKASLIHYQFETIHPFLDGNGRIGRLLVVLYLMHMGLISTPVLYISYFLKRNRVEYYDRLMSVRQNGDYEQWVQFFITAIGDAAANATDIIKLITKLHETDASKIEIKGRSGAIRIALFEYLKKNPIIDIGKTAGILNITYNAVSGAVKYFIKLNILSQTANTKRNRTFSYTAYLDILRDGTE